MQVSQIRQPSQSQPDPKAEELYAPVTQQYKSQFVMPNHPNHEQPVQTRSENKEKIEVVIDDHVQDQGPTWLKNNENAWGMQFIAMAESELLPKSNKMELLSANIPSKIIEVSEEESRQISQQAIKVSQEQKNIFLDAVSKPANTVSYQPHTNSGPSHFNKLINNSMPRQVAFSTLAILNEKAFMGDIHESPMKESQPLQSQKLDGKLVSKSNVVIPKEEDDEERRLIVDMERSRVPTVSFSSNISKEKQKESHGDKVKVEKDEEEKEPEINLERSRVPEIGNNKFARKNPQSLSKSEKYFTGKNPAEIIKNEEDFHGVRLLKSHSLIRNEISLIINPCLKSPGVATEVKEYLQKKKDELLAVQIPPEITQSMNLLHEIEKSNEAVVGILGAKTARADLERVQERLSIIRNQEIAANDNAHNEVANAASILKESVKIVVPARLEELRQRKTQYMQLYTFIKETIVPYLSDKEKSETQQRIEKELKDKVILAEEYLKKDKGNSSKELSSFLDEEMPELEPYMLHGKSVEEREKEINEKIKSLQSYKVSEESLLKQIREKQGSADSENTVQGSIKALEQNIQYLNTLKDEANLWTPLPLIKDGKKLTRVMHLENENIDNNTMVIELTKIDAGSKKGYFIKWQVDDQESKQNKIFRCNKATLLFNDSRSVIFSDPVMDILATKKIKLNLYSPGSLSCLGVMSHLGSATLSLEQFRSNNTIQNSVEFTGGIRLDYILRIKKELEENVVESLTVESFTRFNSFNINISTAISQHKPAVLTTINGTSTPIRDSCPLTLSMLDKDALDSLEKSFNLKGIALQTVLYPDNPDYINSFGVLKEMLKYLEEERMRLIQEMRKEELEKNKEKWDKVLKKSIDIENKIADGELDTESYIKIIEGDLERDIRIKGFYESRGEKERLGFIQEKIRLMEGELQECKAVLEGGI